MTSVKNFVITFFIAALLLGVLAYFVVGYATEALLASPSDNGPGITDLAPVIDNTPAGSIETDGEGNVIFYEINSESFTVLLLGTDYQPDILFDYDLSILNAREKKDKFPYRERIVSADAILLMHIDREQKQFVLCSIPGNTRVSSGGVGVPLASLYDSMGIDYVKDKVSALTGLKIDYHAVISISDFAGIVSSLGGITYNVPCDMHYEDASQGLVISLQKGETQLSGDKALQLLRFNQYEDGVNTRAKTIVSFARALLEKATQPEYLTQALTLYRQWKPGIETNFTESDLTEHLDIIFAYPSFTLTAMTYPGEYRIADDNSIYFDPDTEAAYAAFVTYKNTPVGAQ